MQRQECCEWSIFIATIEVSIRLNILWKGTFPISQCLIEGSNVLKKLKATVRISFASIKEIADALKDCR
jgi:hypothetical protein